MKVAAGARGASAIALEGEALFARAFKETAKLEERLVPKAVLACEEGALAAFAAEEGGASLLAKRYPLFSEIPLETERACDISRQLTAGLKPPPPPKGHASLHQKRKYIRQVHEELKPLMKQPVSEGRLRVYWRRIMSICLAPSGIPDNRHKAY